VDDSESFLAGRLSRVETVLDVLPSVRPTTAMQVLIGGYYDQNEDRRRKRYDGVGHLLIV
jgi:hypothetical protein